MEKVRENHHFSLNFKKKINFLAIFASFCDFFFEQVLGHGKLRYFVGYK